MSWTYYRQGARNGVWMLFREQAGQPSEVFHRQKGWTPDPELQFRKMKGEVDETDIISEAKANDLIASLPQPPPEG